jgi:hypothetical protein
MKIEHKIGLTLNIIGLIASALMMAVGLCAAAIWITETVSQAMGNAIYAQPAYLANLKAVAGGAFLVGSVCGLAFAQGIQGVRRWIARNNKSTAIVLSKKEA